MTAHQIADAIINEVQPTKPEYDISAGVYKRHTFTEKTAYLSLEDAIWRRCKPDKNLANEVYELIKNQFENETRTQL